MKVKWAQITPLSAIPEMYWGEDLTKLDNDYEGDVIGANKAFWGTSYLVVMCTDGKIREVEISKAKAVIDI